MIGPATPAPSELMFWSGTTTATATWGSLAGARPIIQSWLTALRSGWSARSRS